MIISMMMSLPLQLAFEVSPCQTGAAFVILGVTSCIFWIPTCRCVDAVSNTGNNAAHDHFRHAERCDLNDSSNTHDRRAKKNAVLPTQWIADHANRYSAKETANVVDRCDCTNHRGFSVEGKLVEEVWSHNNTA